MLESGLIWSIYGRHLQWVTTAASAATDPIGTGLRLGEAAAEAGFDRVDITVRTGGLVTPAQVSTHLSAMVDGVRRAGVGCDRITAAITPPTQRDALGWWQEQEVELILNAASGCGIKWCRVGTTSFDPAGFGDDLLRQLDGMRFHAERLAAEAARNNLCLVYHTWNRPGRQDISTAIWDIVHVLRDLGPNLGLNFDIGHIVADGPQSLWRINMRYAMPFIRSLSLTEVIWTRNSATGAWKVAYPPAGDGMVPWIDFFRLAHEGGFSGQASLQVECVLPGAKGEPLDMNAALWADDPVFLSGNATRALMIAALRQHVDFYRRQAAAAGY
jgi:sugar phosphate isomerase/epimerase